MQYRTNDAATVCNVTVNTIRNWCHDYSEHLSAGARGVGGNRSFTGRDLEVLKYIAQLRAENMQRPAILQRLSETTFAEIDQSIDIELESNLAVQESPSNAPAPIVTPDYLMMIERRFDALEVQQRAVWWWWVAGLVCGLGLAAVAELFALLASRVR